MFACYTFGKALNSIHPPTRNRLVAGPKSLLYTVSSSIDEQIEHERMRMNE